MTIWRDRLSVALMIVMTALLILAAALMTVVIMMVIAVRTPLIMRLLRRTRRVVPRITVAALRRFGIPAVTMPVHAMLITFTIMMALMIMPPLRRTPVITIPVVTALILIPEVK